MGHSPLYCFSMGLMCLLALADARHKHFHYRVPIVDLNGADRLVGTVREDERLVAVSPQLRILHGTGPICKYELSWADESVPSSTPVPFEAHVLDTAEGTAQIRHVDALGALDCAAQAEFRLRVAAVKCGDESARSEQVELKVQVQDVNNHAPEFDAPWYSFEVDEGRPHAEIARLLATDKDCGHPYGKVCRYELTNTLANSPFRIDERGVLSVQRPLNRSEAESHILTVVAEDCGMQRSKSILVTVHVRARCVDVLRSAQAGVRHLAQQQVEPAHLALFPDAEVVACGEHAECVAEADIELEQSGPQLLGADALAECGMEGAAALELLPGEGVGQKVGDNKEQEKRTDAEDEDEEEDAKWAFNGKSTLVEVPQTKVIPERFTLLFAMRAEQGDEEQQRQKQNILCETDAKGLNRHHFAVYLRRCKLELLLRREPEESTAEFRAAEWRWSDARVCDGEWHSYALAFSDLDNVQLLIDGAPFNTSSERNPEILDDWPLHAVQEHQTRLTVGACWHGRQRQMVQHFRGHLAAMWLWSGQVLPKEALACAHAHHERLTLASETLAQGESVRYASAMDHSQLHLRANSAAQLAELIRRVQFSLEPLISSDKHRRVAPSVRQGERTASLRGHLMCANNGTRPLAALQTTIDVGRAQARPQLSVTGRHLVQADRATLKSGAALLPDVQIQITEGGEDVSGAFKLDWCRVHMRPSRDMDLELFSSPTTLLGQMNAQFVHDKQGFQLKGQETAANYAKVLQHIHYFNLRPEAYPHRSYTLQCAMLGGTVLSGELFTTMQIEAAPTGSDQPQLDDAVQKLVQISDRLDKDEPFGSVSDSSSEEKSAPADKHLEQPSFDQLGSNRLQNILEMDLPRPKALLGHHGYEMGQGAIAGGAVAVVVVICVGFLLVLLVAGVLKMRDHPLPIGGRRRRSRRDSLLEWDDNGMMNITVNPLEQVNKGEPGDGTLAEYSECEEDDEEEEMEDESGSEDGGEREAEVSDDDEDVEEANRMLPLVDNGRSGVGLEWDDSTLLEESGGGGHHHSSAKGFRV